MCSDCRDPTRVSADPLRPLEGLLVVSLEQAVAAPYCTSRLADAGARVIKIERDSGDFARGYDDYVGGESSYFVWLNRGKESAVLDIKAPGDLAILRAMIERADVLVQNLAPGAMTRAGLDLEALHAALPRLISCSISGYGSTGPYAERKAYDLLIQAESGMASITGSPHAPGRIGVSACDIACGMNAHAAVLQALLARELTGRGQRIEVSLFDAMADWMTVPLLHHNHDGTGPARVGLAHPSIAPYGVFVCGDGAEVLLAVQNDREWKDLCSKVLNDAALASRPEFAANIVRVQNRHALEAAITDRLQPYDRASLIRALDAAGVAYGMLNTVGGLSSHPHLRRARVRTPTGEAQLPAPAALVDGRSPTLGDSPALGAHTEAVRAEFAGGSG